MGGITYLSFIAPEIIFRPLAPLLLPEREKDPRPPGLPAGARAPQAAGDGNSAPGPSDPEAASLTLLFDPLPDRVSWDGAESPPASPAFIGRVTPEVPHLLRVEANGFEPQEQWVSLEPGESRTIQVRLEPLSALVELTSTPPGATLFLNDDFDGRKTPIYSLRLPPGESLALRLEKEGYRPWQLSLEPKPGTRERIEATLEPMLGGLRVDSTPAVDVFLGQELLGRTPFVSRDIPVGRHQLRLIDQARSIHHEETILVIAEGMLSKQYTFEGILDLGAVPAGWNVSLDGKPLGQTPLAPVSLPAGTYELALRAGVGDQEQRSTVRVFAGKRSRVTLR